MKIKKLYDLPNTKEGTKIYTKCSDGSKYINFFHIDGMYSYCKSEKDNVTYWGNDDEVLDDFIKKFKK